MSKIYELVFILALKTLQLVEKDSTDENRRQERRGEIITKKT